MAADRSAVDFVVRRDDLQRTAVLPATLPALADGQVLLKIDAFSFTANNVTATLVRLAWSLHLNDRETVSGTLDTTLTFPPGQPTTFPMRMQLNLIEFFDGPAEGLVDLAASVAGLSSDPTRIALRAVPTINTPLGRISYPTPITIVSRTVGGGP